MEYGPENTKFKNSVHYIAKSWMNLSFPITQFFEQATYR